VERDQVRRETRCGEIPGEERPGEERPGVARHQVRRDQVRRDQVRRDLSPVSTAGVSALTTSTNKVPPKQEVVIQTGQNRSHDH